ncbi:putative GNAT family acetyltransferase [Lachnospiraceae bacterium PF1-22]|uniref:GNAT family N-acetyltransferase n=1 Tax=Ohessyouella blattaphilus TaxID=2949333 RepID=UPI003E1AEF15
MVIRCDKSHEEELLKYAGEEAVLNTFLIADILIYGFANDFQEIYVETTSQEVTAETIKGIYLRFYDNLIVYSKEDQVDEAFALAYVREKGIRQVMGREETAWKMVNQLDGYTAITKGLYVFAGDLNKLPKDQGCIQEATLADGERLFAFLRKFPEFRAAYASKDMLLNRLRSGEGRHFFITEGTEIIAGANTAAKSPQTTMIGGVGCLPEFRNRGLATQLVGHLAALIVKEGKIPCLLAIPETEHNLYVACGFTKEAAWTILERNE